MMGEAGPLPLPGQRLIVIGTTGAGKTTLAGLLAAARGIPQIELDALYWGPNWTPVGREQFRERVAVATAGERWVAAGNYGRVREFLWSRADTIIWLDYPLVINFWRLTRRSLRRIVTREELWAGNCESFRSQFLSRDSLFVWAARSHARHRREWREQLTLPAYAHLRVVRLVSPRVTRRWLAALTSD